MNEPLRNNKNPHVQHIIYRSMCQLYMPACKFLETIRMQTQNKNSKADCGEKLFDFRQKY